MYVKGLQQMGPVSFTLAFGGDDEIEIDPRQLVRDDGRTRPRKAKKAIRKLIAGRPLGRRERHTPGLLSYTFPASAVRRP